MKVSGRLAVIEKIAATLQEKYTYVDINAYFAALNIRTPNNLSDFNSKRVYAKSILSGLPLDTIGKIVDDLDLGILARVSAEANPPALWKTIADFRFVRKPFVQRQRQRDAPS